MALRASDFDKSKYFRAADLEGPKKFRIKGVTSEIVGVDDEKEKKLVVWFTNDERGLRLNKTNNRTLRGAFGDVVTGWDRKIITLFPTMVDFRGKMVMGIRVQIPPPKQASGNGHAEPPKSEPPKPEPPKPEPQPDPELTDEPPAVVQQVADPELDDEVDF